jgi:hypothetical protein
MRVIAPSALIITIIGAISVILTGHEGTRENSPAIDGWVDGSETSPVPSGTKELRMAS